MQNAEREDLSDFHSIVVPESVFFFIDYFQNLVNLFRVGVRVAYKNIRLFAVIRIDIYFKIVCALGFLPAFFRLYFPSKFIFLFKKSKTSPRARRAPQKAQAPTRPRPS